MKRLQYLLDKPVPFRSAPELFCLDLYKYFDLDRLLAMASPTEIKRIADEARALTALYYRLLGCAIRKN